MTECPGILPFFSTLAQNNHREWFQAHRHEHEKIKKYLNHLAQGLIEGINRFDPSIGDLRPSDCLYRINRDIRFKTDKSPYKTFTGIYIVKGGKKSPYAGYYLHIEPGNCFVGGGLYAPEKEILNSARMEVYYNYPVFRSIVDNPEFKRYFDGLSEMEKLSRPPRGFPADFEGIDYLKHKHYVIASPYDESLAGTAQLKDYALEVFRVMKPFVDFFNGPVDDVVKGGEY